MRLKTFSLFGKIMLFRAEHITRTKGRSFGDDVSRRELSAGKVHRADDGLSMKGTSVLNRRMIL